ncbi:MAG: SDR family NAD(P)-dependent oxidoreductase [Spirochaetes bacterium]|nr:SDR family NAD(P)-dependent oxidoreductase [Spirochaetota bacterium]
MKSRTIVVTGGNAGIGKAIATELAKQNHHVIIISRNPVKGQKACDEIKNATGNLHVDVIVGDLGSIQSVKNIAQNIINKFPDVSVLINNAGIWPTKLEINPDGLEMAFMVNHMAPLILSTLLYPQLKNNTPARIVNVNAGLYIFGTVDLERTPYGKDFGRFSTYMNTKLCNIYFTQKFAQIIEHSGVTINAVHPGVIRTNLGDSSGITGLLLRLLKLALAKPEYGAQAPVWLAVSPDIENINGKFFDRFTQKPYAKNAVDTSVRDKLWNLSLQLASLKFK